MSHGERSRGKGEGRRRRWWVWLGVLILSLGLLACGLAWLFKSLPSIAIAQLSRLTNTSIQVESSTIRFDGTVTIKGLVVRPKREVGYDNTILKAQSVQAIFDRSSLVMFRPTLRDITVNDFLLDAKYDLDSGRWNLSEVAINMPKGRGEQMPRICLEGGTLRYSRVSQKKSEHALAIPIDALFELHQRTAKGFKFEVKTAPIFRQVGQSRLEGHWQPGLVTLAGGISTTDTPNLERMLAINAMAAQLSYTPAGDYEFTMNIRRLESTRRIESDALDLIPPLFGKDRDPVQRVQAFLDRYQPTGTVDVRLTAQGNTAHLSNSVVSGWVDCTNVSILDLKFPYGMDHLSGRIYFSNEGWHTPGLTGQHGRIPLLVRFWRKGSGEQREYSLHLSSDKMILNDELYQALSPRNQALWSLVDPNGPVGFQYDHRLTRAEGRHQALSVTFKGTNATYRKFPYPLRNLTGKALFQRDQIQFTGVRTNGLPHDIVLDGRILNQTSETPDYDLRIRASGIPVDDTLRQTLRPETRKVMEEVKLRGTIGADIAITSRLDDPRPHYTRDLYLQGASLVLPYRQLNLEALQGGPVRITAESLEIQDVNARFHGDPVSATGSVVFDEGSRLGACDLRIRSSSLSVGNARRALSQQADKSVAWFSPQGKVALDLKLTKAEPERPMQYHAGIDLLGTAVRPEGFPYPFAHVTGGFTVDANRVVLSDIVARPTEGDIGGAQTHGLTVNGRMDLDAGRLERAELRLAASHWPLDPETMLALPDEVSACLGHLAPKGSVTLDPSEIHLTRGQDERIQLGFQINLQAEDCVFQAVGTEGRFTGSLQATGQHLYGESLRRGALTVHARRLTIKEKTAENVRALISYDPNQNTWESHDIMGDFYGGRLLGRLEHAQGSDGKSRVGLQLGLTQSDFGRFMARPSPDSLASEHRSQGILNAELSLMLAPGQEAGRRGRCSFTISDMRVGRAPLLSQLLSALQLTEASDHQFDNLWVDGYIKGNRLEIDKLDMSGESVAFEGAGYLNLLTESIDLQLTARGRRLAHAEPSVIQSLTERIMGAVMSVNLTGSISSPKITRQALPMIEDSIRRLSPPAR